MLGPPWEKAPVRGPLPRARVSDGTARLGFHVTLVQASVPTNRASFFSGLLSCSLR